MAELLFELFSEEIPARMQAQAAETLTTQITERLKAVNISPSKARFFYTPRRITLVLDGVPEKQDDVTIERKGPSVSAPADALQGFLRSTGLTLEQLEKRDSPKGAFYFAVIQQKGRPVAEVLTEIIQDVITNFVWPKSMRWGGYAVRWVRPLQSILALFNGAVLPVRFAHIEAANTTEGHRFLSKQGRFAVKDFADYQAKLRDAFVILDAQERKKIIQDQANQQAVAQGLTVKQDLGLLDEVAGLVEWPVVLMGDIEQRFMEVPSEVLVTTMRVNQRYFSLLDKAGKMAPKFLITSNITATDGGKRIIAGNERVLRARLEDAAFFWNQDQKVKLEDRVKDLGSMVFHASLGTVAEKVERLQKLSVTLARYTKADEATAKRAALLAKADLVTGMVGEFPELQGIMGAYYAAKAKEPQAIVDAIRDHYRPLGPNDQCPKEPVAVTVALADKLDSLVGLFAIGEKPTGSKDPYALRRATLGIIRLITENQLRIPLREALEAALALYPQAAGKKEVIAELLEFFGDRLKVSLKEQSIRHDLIVSVFDGGNEDDVVRLINRVNALDSLLKTDDGINLLAAYKRATNIVAIEEKKDGKSYNAAPDTKLLQQDEEKQLVNRLDALRPTIQSALKAERFTDAMAEVATLRKPVDVFFDKVTVNADDKALRTNRLLALSQIRSFLNQVANFSVIEG